MRLRTQSQPYNGLRISQPNGSEWGISKQEEFIRAVVETVTLGQKNLWIRLDKVRYAQVIVYTAEWRSFTGTDL